MKRKFFSVLFALALVVSFSLIPAMPAGAQATLNVLPFTLEAEEPATSQWSTEFNTGSSSVKLSDDGTSYANVWFDLPGDVTLANIVLAETSFFCKTETGTYIPYLMFEMPGSFTVGENTGDLLRINCDGDESAGYANWTQFVASSTTPEWQWEIIDTSGWDVLDSGWDIWADLVTEHGALVVECIVVEISEIGASAAWVDDIEINGTTYYGLIQDAIDAASGNDTISVAAGTYTEDVDVSVAGITIEGEGLDAIVDGGFYIVSVDTVTIDGLTIQNGRPGPTNEFPAAIAALNSDGHTISNNVIIGAGIAVSKTGIFLKISTGVEIEGNEIYGCGRGIMFITGSHNTTIVNNDIHDNIQEGIGPGESDNSVIKGNYIYGNNIVASTESGGIAVYRGTGHEINYNSIYDNTRAGLCSYDATIDATRNWWGSATGPEAVGNTGGLGNSVICDHGVIASYSPWLYYTTADDGGDTVANIAANEVPAYAEESVVMDAGWNTFSVPIGLDGQYNNWDQLISLTSLDYDIAWRFDVATQQFEGLGTNSDYAIAPGEGFYIKMNSAGSIPYCYNTEFSLPTRDLKAGWNFIGGGMTPMDERDACISIATAGGTAGYSHIISPAENDSSWFYITGAENSSGDFLVGKGYWVFLIIDRQLGLFDGTPVTWVSLP